MDQSSGLTDIEIDPSDEAEYERLVKTGRLDEVDDAALGSLGIGPEFFGIK